MEQLKAASIAYQPPLIALKHLVNSPDNYTSDREGFVLCNDMVILSTWEDSVYTTAITLMHQLTGILLQQCNNTVSNFSSITINLQQSIIMYCVEINLGDGYTVQFVLLS